MMQSSTYMYDDFSDRSLVDLNPIVSRHFRHQPTLMSAVRTLVGSQDLRLCIYQLHIVANV